MMRTTLNVHWQQHINNQEQYGILRQESVKQFVLALLKEIDAP